MVLLDRGAALPLIGEDGRGPSRIAVVGPCADDPRTFLGCYSFPNHVLAGRPELGLGVDVPTALDALRAEFPDADVVHQVGCAVTGDDRAGFAAAAAATREADLCVAFVGDQAGLFGRGTSGEGCDAEDLRLPGVQADLLVVLFGTGTPVVVVVVSGRPYALGEVAGRAAGLVQAFMPGEEGGPALAGILSGRVQPSGRLPVQIPRHPGGQPGTYLQPPLGAQHTGTSSLDPTPLFPFGYGRAYTSFSVGDLRISDAEVATDAEFTVSVRVTNTGERAGTEVVQLYLSDPVATVTRPVRQLVGFTRVELAPDATADVCFAVHTDRTAFTGAGPEAHRRARRPRRAGRSLGRRPARPGARTADRAGTGRRTATATDHPGRDHGAGRTMTLEQEPTVRESSGKGQTTLARVAASAGVSVATVSKVLNGRADVGPETRARVQTMLAQHDYVPRRSESAVPDGDRHATVELVLHGVLSSYFLEVLQGALDGGGEAGVSIAVSVRPRPLDGGVERSAEWVRRLTRLGRTAVIDVVDDVRQGDLSALTRSRLPLVVIDPLNFPRRQIASVGVTNFAGGVAATQHLLDLGHTRIAYLGALADAASNQARAHGYRAAMEAARVEVLDGYVRNGELRLRHRAVRWHGPAGPAAPPQRGVRHYRRDRGRALRGRARPWAPRSRGPERGRNSTTPTSPGSSRHR